MARYSSQRLPSSRNFHNDLILVARGMLPSHVLMCKTRVSMTCSSDLRLIARHLFNGGVPLKGGVPFPVGLQGAFLHSPCSSYDQLTPTSVSSMAQAPHCSAAGNRHRLRCLHATTVCRHKFGVARVTLWWFRSFSAPHFSSRTAAGIATDDMALCLTFF